MPAYEVADSHLGKQNPIGHSGQVSLDAGRFKNSGIVRRTHVGVTIEDACHSKERLSQMLLSNLLLQSSIS
jgi:hypothetical protein